MSVLKASLIGQHIAYSISPRVHEEIFKIIGARTRSGYTSIDYTVTDCDERCDFADWLKKAPSNGIKGVNVTIPFKSDAYTLTDEHVGLASAIESANVIALNGKSVCASTDGEGFLSAILREYPEFNLEKYNLICIGSGDTARAILYSLCTRWMPKTLTIANRTLEHAEALASFCIAQAPGPTVRPVSLDDLLSVTKDTRYNLVIQATPVGNVNNPGNPIEGFNWHELDFAIDLTYKPTETPFLKSAAAAGARTMNGLGMLIEQAAMAQHYWLMGELPQMSPLSDDEYCLVRTRLIQELS